jgi:hypothetical protein
LFVFIFFKFLGNVFLQDFFVVFINFILDLIEVKLSSSFRWFLAIYFGLFLFILAFIRILPYLYDPFIYIIPLFGLVSFFSAYIINLEQQTLFVELVEGDTN